VIKKQDIDDKKEQQYSPPVHTLSSTLPNIHSIQSLTHASSKKASLMEDIQST
jgi:hypothetical protein